MPRGVYARKSKKRSVSTEVTAVAPKVPMAFIESPWWKKAKLSEEEQAIVLEETPLLAEDLQVHGSRGMSAGMRLKKLRNVLEPHNVFGRYLRDEFHWSVTTAYRYIRKYDNASKLPEPIVMTAMSLGMEIGGDNETRPFGRYTAAVAKLPPPATANAEQARTYLDKLEQVRKETKVTPIAAVPETQDAATLLKECYRFCASRYKKLPNNSRTRQSFIKQLIGLLYSEFGVNTTQAFAPVSIPEDFKLVPRGRPRTLVATA